jgi:hypothetical protein
VTRLGAGRRWFELRISPRASARETCAGDHLLEEGLVGKIEPASSPPIQKKGSWGSWRELPHHLYRIRPRGEAGVNCPTTYTEDGLVGKLVNVRNLHPLSSPPPIQKMASWGSWGQLPHHLYRRRARGEVSKRPQLTPPIFPTTYTEEGLVGKLGSTSPPPIQKKASVVEFRSRRCYSRSVAR